MVPARGRVRLLEIEHRAGTCLGIALTGERQHLGEIRLVGGARLIELGIGLQIIIAIGHAEARLVYGDDIAIGMLVVLTDTQAAQIADADARSEEHTAELQSLMGISSAVFCLKKTK